MGTLDPGRLAVGAVLRNREAVGERPGWLARAREILEDATTFVPRLSDVAAEVDVGPLRLARAFRRAYGESAGDYLRRKRIRLSCELIRDPKASLADVARSLGLADQSHFTRVFRRVVGITPGAWRREHGRPSDGGHR